MRRTRRNSKLSKTQTMRFIGGLSSLAPPRDRWDYNALVFRRGICCSSPLAGTKQQIPRAALTPTWHRHSRRGPRDDSFKKNQAQRKSRHHIFSSPCFSPCPPCLRGEPAVMYIEFHSRSAFSFLEGASLPEALIAACAEYGM